MRELYVSYTPYHILLNSSIAFYRDESIEKDLIIIEDFSNAKEIVNGLKNWGENPFKEIVLIDGKFSLDLVSKKSVLNIFKRNSVVNLFRKGVSTLKKRYGNMTFDTVFTCNDERPQSQYLENKCRKNNGLNVYVEDGSALYNDHVGSSLPFLEYIFIKLYVGSWYEDISIIGNYKFTDEIRAFRPDLVREDLKNKKIEPIDVENFVDLKRTGLTESILNELQFKQPLNKDYIIIFLPHSSLIKEKNLLSLYKEIISGLENYNDNILLKYHPREKDHYLGNVGKDISGIPKSIPSEIILLQMIENPPIVIGDVSTCLLTSKVLKKESHVISLIDILNIESKNLKRVFENIGVDMPKTQAELEDILKNI